MSAIRFLAALVAACVLFAGCLPDRNESSLSALERLQIAVKTGEPAEAQRIANRLLSSSSANLQTYKEVRDAYAAAGKSQEAVKIIQRALREKPGLSQADQATLHLYLAGDSFAGGALDAARTEYEIALEMAPNNAQALNDYAFFLAEQGVELERALKMARRALADEPDFPPPLDTVGWVLHKMDRNEEAEEYLSKAVKGAGDHPEVLLHYGIVLEALGKHKEAVSVYVRSMDNAASGAKAAKAAGERLKQLDPDAWSRATSLKRWPGDPIYPEATGG